MASSRKAMLASVCVTLALAACAHDPSVLMERAAATADPTEALRLYDQAAGHAKTEPAARVRAHLEGARLCKTLGNLVGVRLRLEQAVALEVPGASEPAYYQLAELLRAEDRARALNLYYQAAAGAERNLASGFPYTEAMKRIVELNSSGN